MKNRNVIHNVNFNAEQHVNSEGIFIPLWISKAAP